MSRIGKLPISIPAGTTVSVDASAISVKGPKGELSRPLSRHITVSIDGDSIVVTPNGNSQMAQALWGTYASHIGNMVTGVNEPFTKHLSVEGVGYKVDLQGSDLVLNVGYSHPVKMPVPKDLTVAVEKNAITISGADKEAVGQFAAEVRAVRKPEPYKGKGIRYSDEIVRRKQGKKGAA
ncbi:50S ribosomal protein L6 [Candidatus Kaiserbacteria bacterium CG10_big_fil_rev_8_21_14_0_10_49_17]|uniref:Large ribosomal subunit protein uL6 n=1 Tax=Candidatus Kaiserbacteria bacterium CG10_big_fil_rev_8_21_14_0_10_49_17 TaxID=1974609 RepID=A0A2M6WEM2_9BACT|nr:MAG: 50S ribosomal protein L6 [Candidatus Kaiserbacteria bacterium CG10_big_fil_rev_8_21_14_0_10_49_17]